MKNYKNILLGVCVIFFANACNPNLEQFFPEAGTADFTSYVAIGNSFTAGYADGALSYSGQQNAFPVILAKQFELVGGGEFRVPFLPVTGNGNDGTGATKRELAYLQDCRGALSVAPRLAATPATVLANVGSAGPYNLLGVPGIRAVDINLGIYSLFNPFLGRIVPQPGVNSLTSQVNRANPTFFSVWLGSNDVLGYATGGGLGKVDPTSPVPGDLSASAQVAGSIKILLDSLTKRGAKGVIANIPDITSVPFFTTIPYNGVVLTAKEAKDLDSIYARVGHPEIKWKAGQNAFVIEDTTVAHPSLRIRHARANELILLSTPSDSLKCAGWGVSPFRALGDRYVLDAGELAEIFSHTAKYNAAIANMATTYDLGLVDMNSYLKRFTSGIVYNGASFNSSYISGGTFSLDGVHPNPRGYAMVANEFLRVINAKFGAKIPEVDVNKYPGIIFP